MGVVADCCGFLRLHLFPRSFPQYVPASVIHPSYMAAATATGAGKRDESRTDDGGEDDEGCSCQSDPGACSAEASSCECVGSFGESIGGHVAESFHTFTNGRRVGADHLCIILLSHKATFIVQARKAMSCSSSMPSHHAMRSSNAHPPAMVANDARIVSYNKDCGAWP